VLALPPAQLREAGLSARKAEYLHDLSRHFGEGSVHVGQWQQMDDEAIIAELVAIRGIGRWTAEMFLIFHLMRPNVLPLDDLGLLRASASTTSAASRCRAPRRARWPRPGRLSARWPHGTFGAASIPLPVDY
jgi:DNA-3-methyladenine glycosylase II